MEIEGIIFSLFMVAILLTVSVADNITGRAIDISSASFSGCKTMCVKDIPICGKGSVCINDLKIIFDKVSSSVPSYKKEETTTSEDQAYSYVTKCPDKCLGSTAANVPNYIIAHYKLSNGECIPDYSENCKAYPHFEYGKFKECIIVNSEGICKETDRAENYAKSAAAEEGQEDVIV